MKISQSIKPISYLKSHAEEMIRTLNVTRGVYILTENDEAKAVLQDIKTYEEIEEAITFLKIMALSEESIRQGKSRPMREAFADIRKKIKELQKSENKDA